MQLFTIEQLYELFVQSRETSRELTGSFVAAIWHNTLNLFPSFFSAIGNHDWGLVGVYMLMIIGSGILLYRLIRKVTFKILQTHFDI